MAKFITVAGLTEKKEEEKSMYEPVKESIKS